MSPKKKKPLPAPQDAVEINPESSTPPSDKTPKRPQEKRTNNDWVDKVHWFGE